MWVITVLESAPKWFYLFLLQPVVAPKSFGVILASASLFRSIATKWSTASTARTNTTAVLIHCFLFSSSEFMSSSRSGQIVVEQF